MYPLPSSLPLSWRESIALFAILAAISKLPRFSSTKASLRAGGLFCPGLGMASRQRLSRIQYRCFMPILWRRTGAQATESPKVMRFLQRESGPVQ